MNFNNRVLKNVPTDEIVYITKSVISHTNMECRNASDNSVVKKQTNGWTLIPFPCVTVIAKRLRHIQTLTSFVTNVL